MLEVHLKQMIRFGEKYHATPGARAGGRVADLLPRRARTSTTPRSSPAGRSRRSGCKPPIYRSTWSPARWMPPGRVGSNRVARGSADSDANGGHARHAPKRPRPAAAADDNALACLAVRFEGSLNGNIHTHEATFHEQVRRRAAPVDRWDATIDPDRPEHMDPRRVLMRATISGWPKCRRPSKASALRKCRPWATPWSMRRPSPPGRCGSRTCRPKDLLILEGDGWTDAELFRQHADRRTDQPHRVAADRVPAENAGIEIEQRPRHGLQRHSAGQGLEMKRTLAILNL